MEYKTLIYETNGPIGVLTLNRPDRLNAINMEMWEELLHFFSARLTDLDTRVLIMTGAGRGFCAGLDMKETKIVANDPKGPYDPKRAYEEQSHGTYLVVLMRRVPQPIIAAVNGSAAGAGFSLTLASDVLLAAPEAKFLAAYINIGVGGADMGSSWFFPRMVGAANASRYLLTGDTFSAVEAHRMGLVQAVVEKEKLMAEAMGLAQKMVSKSPLGLRLTKEAITRNMGGQALEDAVHIEDRNQALCIALLAQQLQKMGTGT
jgi:enoyl-CoA hydratase